MTQLLDRPPVALPPAKVRKRKLTLRALLRGALKPFVMASIAVALALSLTVTTTQKAEANPLLIPPLLLASGTMPVGTAMGLVSLTGPIGWGILGIAAVGIGLAATQDYWLPYVTGDFGKPQGEDDGTTTSGFVRARDGLVIAAPTPTMSGKSGLQTTVTYATPPRSGDWYLDVALLCKRPDGTQYGKSIQAAYGYAASTSVRFDCNETYEVLLEGQMGAVCSLTVTYTSTNCTTLSSFYGPTNVVSWGVNSKAFDPKGADVVYKTTVECVRPDGSFFSLTAESTGDQSSVKVPSCAAAVPGSHGTGKTTITGDPPGTMTPQPVWTNPRIPASAEYPLCAPERPGPMCSLAVTVDGKPCIDAVGSWNCANWREIANQDSTRVQCSYGPYSGLAVDVCNPMERAYETPDGTFATEANTDGNPATRNDATPEGQQYQKPQSNTGTGTGTSTIPQTGTNPGVDGVPGESGQNCLSTGWSWNPVSWVMVPVQCAMQWAFVPPRVRVDAALQTVQPRLEVRGIQPLIAPFMANFAGLGGNGCKGPGIDLGSIGVGSTFYPFDACSEPMSGIASGVNAFFSLSIVVQGGMSCIRGAAAAFGFNWGLGGKPGAEE